VHTSHPAFGYRIEARGCVVVWAPEFWKFPRWARDADLMFAEAAAWGRPIRFAGGVGGHLHVEAVARAARAARVRRLIFAHIGRPTLRALSRGLTPSFGEFAVDRQCFVCRGRETAARHVGRGLASQAAAQQDCMISGYQRGALRPSAFMDNGIAPRGRRVP
jgi:hypothetical protein